MSPYRLRGKAGHQGPLPYLQEQLHPNHFQRRGSTKYSSKRDQRSCTVPPLTSLALKLLLATLEDDQDFGQSTLTLPDFGLFPRMSFDPNILPFLYPKLTPINTSPLRWAILCRLYTGLPPELQTFYLPLSDPYILPIQR